MSENKKRQVISFVLCLLFGTLGVHKFYQKKTALGILYVFTIGLFGIGWLVDLIRLFIDMVKPEDENEPIPEAAQTGITAKPKNKKIAIVCAVIAFVVILVAFIGILGSSENVESDSKITTTLTNSTTRSIPETVSANTTKALSTTATTSAETPILKTTTSTKSVTASTAKSTIHASNNNSVASTAKTTKRVTTTKKATTVRRTEPPKTSPAPATYTYVANTNTMVFHYSSCHHVKRINAENRLEITATADAMKAKGYTPCKTCNPR